MGLRTVKVPEELEERFAAAEKVVSRYFAEFVRDPERGTIEIFGERYVLVRAASLSVEFFTLVRGLYGPGHEAEADEFSRNLLFDLSHALGASDARRFHRRMKLEDPIERLTAGPVHFAHAGWALVHIHPESSPVPDESYRLVYDHPDSFEAAAWLDAGRDAGFPVCIMNAGYSSGWCEESFGLSLVASEVLCRARGDESCRFVMAHPERIEESVERHRREAPAVACRIRGYQIPGFFARKRAEEELRRAHSELEQRVEARTAELRNANDRLRQEMGIRRKMEAQLLQTAKMEAIGRLAGGLAHDFNNLMGVVIGHASMLERKLAQADPGVVAQLAEIREAGEHAAQLNRQLLAFSRTELVQRAAVDLNEVVLDTRRMLDRLIGEDVRIVTDLDDSIGAVIADRSQLGQVVMNLAVNARDAMPSGGELRIETARLEVTERRPDPLGEVGVGTWVRLTMSDDGVGMDEHTLAHAFDPFFTTKPVGEGTGLGLSTVYGIVTQSDGTVRATSSPGEGTRVRVYLPSTTGVEGEAREDPSMGALPRGDETILVCEDQEAVRRMMVRILDECGYHVIEAGDPQEAIEVAGERGGRIDLLLTDVVMPHTSGRVLADGLTERYPGMKVLFTSGYTADQVLRRGVEHGKAHFLAKPFTPQALARRVRQVLDGPARAPST